MASTNFTTHYSIPLPLGTDLTTPMDYNEAAEAIDTALFGAVTDAGNAATAAGEAVNTANTASAAVDTIRADLALEKAKIVQLQTRMTAAENDIDDVYTDVTDMITAYKEPSATSTHAYAIGDYFIYNETLYKATATIAIGATIVPNTNCEATNVSTELIQINNDLTTGLPKVLVDGSTTSTYGTFSNLLLSALAGLSTLELARVVFVRVNTSNNKKEFYKISEFEGGYYEFGSQIVTSGHIYTRIYSFATSQALHTSWSYEVGTGTANSQTDDISSTEITATSYPLIILI